MKTTDKKKTLRNGIGWSSFGQIGTQALSFGFGIVLARLLEPSEFGLLAMVVVFTGFAEVFKDLGFGSAIIQRKDLEDKDLSTSFWLNVGIGFLLFLIFFFSSELIANFYDNPEIILITKVISVNFVISALSATHQSLVIRNLDFKLRAKLTMISLTISSLTGVILAFKGYGVWALIFSMLLKNGVLCLLYWKISSWKPSFKVSKSSFKILFQFGSMATLNSIFGYLSKNTDNLIIGKLMGDFSLGLYSRAYGIMLLPIRNISGGFKTALFPTLSKIQDNLIEVKRLYLKSTRLVAFLSFPLMFGLSALAEPFVLFVYGENWLEMVPVLKLLSLLGALSSLMTFNGTIFYSMGRPSFETKIYLITTPALILAFFFGIKMNGLIGLSIGLIVVEILSASYKILLLRKIINLSFLEFFKNIQNIFFNTCIMYLILEGINYSGVIVNFHPLLQLIVLFSTGSIIYLVLSWMNNKDNLKFVQSLLRKKKPQLV